MDNEEHIPTNYSYKQILLSENGYKERCSEDVLNQKTKESKAIKKGWTVGNPIRHKVAYDNAVLDSYSWQLANISGKIKNEPSFLQTFYKYFKKL